ncbi:hypothetical protein BLA29_014363, partial [Euroglyphus maynei]
MEMVNMEMITLDIDEQQCFHEKYVDEKVNGNVKLSIIFDVIVGGFNDVNFHLKNTRTGHSLYNSLRTSNDRLMIAINEPGTYEYCFDNDGSTVSQSIKWIRFNVVITFNHPTGF